MNSNVLWEVIEISQQKKKRRLDLQRANYKHHNELAKQIVESYIRSVDHHSDEQEHNELNFNIPINTLQSNLNQSSNFITQSAQDLQDTNNVSLFTPARNIEEDKLASSCITSSFCIDNGEASESVNTDSEGTVT